MEVLTLICGVVPQKTRAYHGPSLSAKEAKARQIDRLPATATSFYDDLDFFGWGAKLRELLIGTRDRSCELYKLRGQEDTLLRYIFSFVASEWGEHVRLTIPASCIGRLGEIDMARFNTGRPNEEWQKLQLLDNIPISSKSSDEQGFVSFAVCGKIDFPEPSELNVNMLPFIFGDKDSLPEELQCYYDCIENCPYLQEEVGKIGYLTVQESYVDIGKAQRREGLHIETPG